MTEPFLFSFHFPDDRGMKRNTEMTREELLEVIDWLSKDSKAMREQFRRDLDFLSGRPRSDEANETDQVRIGLPAVPDVRRTMVYRLQHALRRLRMPWPEQRGRG